jgi:hypothetical protein
MINICTTCCTCTMYNHQLYPGGNQTGVKEGLAAVALPSSRVSNTFTSRESNRRRGSNNIVRRFTRYKIRQTHIYIYICITL